MNIRDELRIMNKGIKTLYSINSQYIIYTVMEILFSVLSCYVPILLSALIINEIVYLTQNSVHVANIYEKIIFQILFTIVITMLIRLLERFFINKKNLYNTIFFMDEKRMFAEKNMNMRFEYAEKDTTVLLKGRIDSENQSGYNMWTLYDNGAKLIHGCIGVGITFAYVARLLMVTDMPIYMKILLFAFLCIVIILNAFCNMKMRQSNNEMMEKWGPLNRWNNFYNDYLKDYKYAKDIRLFGMQNLIFKNVENLSKRQMLFSMGTNQKNQKYILGKGAFSLVLKTVIYIYIISAFLDNNVQIGEIAASVAYIILCVRDMMEVIDSWQQIINNNIYLRRYFEYLEFPEERINKYEMMNNHRIKRIEFIHVSFKYPDTDNYVLKDLNLSIEYGEKIAIVGKNGSGKTTFIKLLCRLYEPTDGKILLDGKDIQEYDYKEYIKKISVVFQDFTLFSLSIGENIAGDKTVDKDKVIECILKVDDKLSLSDCLDSYIYKYASDDGLEISGGEAQKLAIARALYKNGDIMILDEPTSAMDAKSEEELFLHFNSVVNDKNIFFISHRLSACSVCDRILVFDHQNICQQGKHAELLKETTGLYYKMWNAQTRNYIM